MPTRKKPVITMDDIIRAEEDIMQIFQRHENDSYDTRKVSEASKHYVMALATLDIVNKLEQLRKEYRSTEVIILALLRFMEQKRDESYRAYLVKIDTRGNRTVRSTAKWTVDAIDEVREYLTKNTKFMDIYYLKLLREQ